MRYLFITLLGVLAGSADSAILSFPSLQACNAEMASALNSSQSLFQKVLKISGAIQDTAEYRAWRSASDHFNSVTDTCRAMEAAQRAKSSINDPRVSAEKATGDLNDLHEIITDKVTGSAVPGRAGRMIKGNMSVARDDMAAIARTWDDTGRQIDGFMNNGPATKGSSLPPLGSRTPVGRSVLGADAAASLTADVNTWKAQEAARQELQRIQDEARRAEQARVVAEQARIAQAQYQAQVAAEEERRANRAAVRNSFFGGLLKGGMIGLAARGGGNSALAQQYLQMQMPAAGTAASAPASSDLETACPGLLTRVQQTMDRANGIGGMCSTYRSLMAALRESEPILRQCPHPYAKQSLNDIQATKSSTQQSATAAGCGAI
jgi:hypothetical protein